MTNQVVKTRKVNGEVKTVQAVVVSPSFINPRYIEELGEEGLTAVDIANSLGIAAKEIREKLQRGEWCTSPELFPRAYAARSSKGHKYQEYALTTTAAKVFIARYSNEVSDKYLLHLIALEQATVNFLKDQTVALESKLKLAEKYKDAVDLSRHITVYEFLRENKLRTDLKVGSKGYNCLVAVIHKKAPEDVKRYTQSRGHEVKRFERSYLETWVDFIGKFSIAA